MKSLIVLLLVVSFMSASFGFVTKLDNMELQQSKFRLETDLEYALNDFHKRCIGNKHPICNVKVTTASK